MFPLFFVSNFLNRIDPEEVYKETIPSFEVSWVCRSLRSTLPWSLPAQGAKRRCTASLRDAVFSRRQLYLLLVNVFYIVIIKTIMERIL